MKKKLDDAGVTAVAQTAGSTIKQGAATTWAATQVGAAKLNSAIEANPTLAQAKTKSYQGLLATTSYAKKGLGSVGSYFGWGKRPAEPEPELPE